LAVHGDKFNPKVLAHGYALKITGTLSLGFISAKGVCVDKGNLSLVKYIDLLLVVGKRVDLLKLWEQLLFYNVLLSNLTVQTYPLKP